METVRETETEMEMEAAEEETEMGWKALFRRRVVMADARCRTLHGLLHGLVVDFSERRIGVMAGVGAEEEAQRALEGGAAELGLAFADMGAARYLALRCCGRRVGARLDPDTGPSPSSPRALSPLSSSPSSSYVDNDDGDLLADTEAARAVGLLRKARELVRVVHDLVESARGHLGAAELLLLALGEEERDDRDGAVAPWVHDPCAAQQLNGIMDLGEAFSRAIDLVELTAAAREAAFNVGGD